MILWTKVSLKSQQQDTLSHSIQMHNDCRRKEN